MEVIHDLVGYQGRKIVQNTEWFSFSLDSVLLARFVRVLPRMKNILDLGTGNAPIPLILSLQTKAHITAVEIQPDVCQLARKSVSLNHLEEQITVLEYDMMDLKEKYNSDTFDLITMNPPYFPYHDTSFLNMDIHKTIARHEIRMNLKDMLPIVRYLLKNNGSFAMVHRVDRFMEILSLLQYYHLEPKRIQFIYPKKCENANLFLIEAVKNGKTGMTVLSPLIIHEADGSYTEHVKEFFM